MHICIILRYIFVSTKPQHRLCFCSLHTIFPLQNWNQEARFVKSQDHFHIYYFSHSVLSFVFNHNTNCILTSVDPVLTVDYTASLSNLPDDWFIHSFINLVTGSTIWPLWLYSHLYKTYFKSGLLLWNGLKWKRKSSSFHIWPKSQFNHY